MGFMSQNVAIKENTTMLRWMVIAAIAVIAFFGSYRFAQASSSVPAASTPASGVVSAAGPAGTPQATAGGGCCGSGGSGAAASGSTSGGGGCCGGSAKSGPAVSKKATVAGNVQTASVDLSKGYYDPNTIELKAGVPAEITFGQASGCLSQVQSQRLGFFEDLTKGAVTIKLPALPAGTYTFTCGMQMQSGTIVVK
jgi:hypothetical protein